MRRVQYKPMPGDYAYHTAARMADSAASVDVEVCALFNGTLMWAGPTDTADAVYQRWSVDRERFQVAKWGKVS